MTMVNTAITNNSATKNAVSLRKTNKPLMEKRRRARINDSLSQLKSLVIHSSKKDSSQFSKLEKADILELTVKHLRGLQAQQQQQLQQHQLSSLPSTNVTSDAFVNGKYRAGFAECAGEVIRYLDQAQGLNPETKSKVISHLAGCLQIVSSSTSSSSSLQPQQPQHFNHAHNQQPQHLSKVIPQPISASTPLPPQQIQSSNNAAAILAAAAAAVNNPNNTAPATTQLPNGQIIQIVSNGTSNIQPSAVMSLAQSQNHAGLSNSTHNAPVIMKQASLSITSVPNSSMPSTTQPAFIHYAQPLHIQIPPIVSPILINKTQSNIQRPPSNHQKQEQPKQFIEESKELMQDYPPSLPDQPNPAIVSSSTNPVPVPATSNPQPKPSRQSTSPPSLYPGHPKARAQKQLNFFTQEFNNADNKYCSRFSKNDLTPPPSSASSSSSESENTSPLNLSQSPPLAVYKLHKRYHPYANNLEEKFTNSNNFSTNNKSINLLTENQNRLRESHNVHYSTHQPMSVIVDSRNKCSDFNTGKYWSMMEEDRQCTVRHQNTPSPASSVGEERLWRPW